MSQNRATTWRDTVKRWLRHLSLSRALDEQQELFATRPVETWLTMVVMVVGGGVGLYFLVHVVVAIESQENGWQLVWP